MNEILIILGLILLNGHGVGQEVEPFLGFKFQIVDKDNARIDKIMVSRD